MSNSRTNILNTNIDNLQQLLESNRKKSNRNTLQPQHKINKTLVEVINSLAYYEDITSKTGFAKLYFDLLPHYKTTKTAFEKANNLFKQQTGEFKYNSIKDFKRALFA